MSRFLIFEKDSAGSVDVRLEGDSVWLTQQQLAELLDTDRSSISRHIGNVLKSGELDKSTCAVFTQVRQEGNRQISREIEHYNLDMIISVSYRVNSRRGTQFRQWATARLREYLVEGAAINENRLARLSAGVSQVKHAVALLRSLKPDSGLIKEVGGLSDLLFRYVTELETSSVGMRSQPNGGTRGLRMEPEQAKRVIGSLRVSLRADAAFGRDRSGQFEGILRLCMDHSWPQSRQAAEVLYRVVRERPFEDGNKRIAALLFLYHVEINTLSGKDTGGSHRFSAAHLSGLTWLISNSEPSDKPLIIAFIMNLVESP